MRPIEIRFVHRSMQRSYHIFATLMWHTHPLQQAFAQNHRFIDQPRGARKMILALVLFVFPLAMLQNHVLLFVFVPYVNMMLLELLDFLDMDSVMFDDFGPKSLSLTRLRPMSSHFSLSKSTNGLLDENRQI